MVDILHHCFISRSGELLPRWASAFPLASACSFDNPDFPERPSVIWIHAYPGLDLVHAITDIRRIFPVVPLAVLSNQPDDDEALLCFSMSVRAYLNAYAVPELLQRVSEVVVHGGVWIGESLMQRLLKGFSVSENSFRNPINQDCLKSLTEREVEVALAVARGSSNKEVAQLLGITERTVKAHSSAIFEKLGVRDRLQLSLLVHGHGISEQVPVVL